MAWLGADDPPFVVNTDQQVATICVGEADHGFYEPIVANLGLELNG